MKDCDIRKLLPNDTEKWRKDFPPPVPKITTRGRRETQQKIEMYLIKKE